MWYDCLLQVAAMYPRVRGKLDTRKALDGVLKPVSALGTPTRVLIMHLCDCSSGISVLVESPS